MHTAADLSSPTAHKPSVLQRASLHAGICAKATMQSHQSMSVCAVFIPKLPTCAAMQWACVSNISKLSDAYSVSTGLPASTELCSGDNSFRNECKTVPRCHEQISTTQVCESHQECRWVTKREEIPTSPRPLLLEVRPVFHHPLQAMFKTRRIHQTPPRTSFGDHRPRPNKNHRWARGKLVPICHIGRHLP